MITKKNIIGRDESAGIEYYINADGKVVQQRIDQLKDYRKSELDPAVLEIFEDLRMSGTYPKKEVIDRAAALDPAAAVSWLRWRYYGDPWPERQENKKNNIDNFYQKKLENQLDALSQEIAAIKEAVYFLLDESKNINQDKTEQLELA